MRVWSADPPVADIVRVEWAADWGCRVLELLKTLLESLATALPNMKGARRDKKHAEIGVQLLDLYLKANECFAQGREVTRSLRVYVERMERHLSHGDDPYALTAGHWLHDSISLQAYLLSELQKLYQKLAPQLGILYSQKAHITFSQLWGRKASAVNALLDAMRSGIMVLDSNSALEDLTARGQELKRPFYPGPWDIERFDAYERQLDRLPTNVPWEAEFLEHVKRYLAVRQPERQLDELAPLLEQLRQAILANFELKDVLLAVGDNASSRR